MLSNYMKSAIGYVIVFVLFTGVPNISAQEWSTPIRISEIVEGWRPQILAAGDTVHAVYINSVYWHVVYTRSIDGGESWQEPQVLSDTSEDLALRPQILKYGAKLMVLWCASLRGNSPDRNIGYNISTDNGLTWTTPAYILNPNWNIAQRHYSSSHGQIINNTITSHGDGNDMYIYNVRSTDFGETWSEPALIFQPHSIGGNGDQVSSGNYVHLVWTGSIEGGSPRKPYYMKSTDSGLTWSDNIELGVCDVFSQHVAISVNSKGVVGVLWIGESNNVNLRISHDFGDTWEPAIEVSSNYTARGSCDIKLAGQAILTCWEGYRINPQSSTIYFKKSLNGGQNWDEAYYIDRDPDHSWNPSLTGTTNRHYMIWYDGRSVGGRGIYFSRWPGEITSVDNEEEVLPERISLSAYPNPFNSSTTISYTGLASGDIGIYDIRGRLVKTLLVNDPSGSITWDASADNGSKIASGIYFIRAVEIERKYAANIKLLYLK